MERQALIFNVQKYNTHDGQGVRTLVFFKGCPLRCLWCSNPESQSRLPQVMFKADACVHCGACVAACPQHIHSINAVGKHEVDTTKKCIGCKQCVPVCIPSALHIAGENMSISALADIVEEDMPFYQISGGGLTIGGGEPLMQAEAVISLLEECQRRGIPGIVETCGYAPQETVLKVARNAVCMLYDIKHMDPEQHKALTGVENSLILSNLRALLDAHRPVKVRLPLLKGINDGEQNLQALVNFLRNFHQYANFLGVDILPYHRLGVGKYTQLGMEYLLHSNYNFEHAELERIKDYFMEHKIETSILTH